MKQKDSISGKSAIDLIEEAVHVLRRAPFTAVLAYYAGTFPFVLSLLYFWADMSRGPLADGTVAESAFALSLMYVWMKCWQAVFANRIFVSLTAGSAPHYTFGKVARMFLTQLILQPYSFVALPAALIVFLPFGWVYAFYHNLSVVGNGETLDIGSIFRRAWAHASTWPGQNHKLIPILFLFSGVIFLNLATMALLIPQLIRTLLGIETIFTLSGFHMLNTTFLAVISGLTYLLVNPLIKTVYTLRCFYAESLRSGADLIAELREITEFSR